MGIGGWGLGFGVWGVDLECEQGREESLERGERGGPDAQGHLPFGFPEGSFTLTLTFTHKSICSAMVGVPYRSLIPSIPACHGPTPDSK